ncbi:glycosyltransferase family 2 protein [Methylotenera sp.]|uniref:glycosyltransferase family 2 protein n=1 Tax=Methylotenera sp. TaxID=2051956 RepID=UPI00272FB32E|nr:glycosyltransferase family 2 protein [Methylotenera sp.]MDP2230726.1 glycosyltransferase family 2 protein [Methylotenera sp.]
MSHLSSPLVSIIVAVFNGAKTLQQCIDSVAQQTYINIELIIIDGGSTDGTVDLLKANQENISYWVSEPDKGIYNAWNKGLTQVKGEWICFLGADDFLWDAQVIELISQQLEKIPSSIRVAYGKIMLLDNDAEPLHLVGDSWGKVQERFKQMMCIPHQGVMHRLSLFDCHGKFDESFRIAGDYELLMRELKTADAAFLLNVVVAGMRQGGISSNPKESLVLLHELRRAQSMHGLPLGRFWVFALVKVYIRLILWKVLGEKLTRKLLDVGRRGMGLQPYWTQT